MSPETVFSERFLAHSRIPVIILDRDGVPLKWNPSTRVIFPEISTASGGNARRTLKEYLGLRLAPDDPGLTGYALPQGESMASVEFPSRAKDKWFRLLIQRQDDEGFFCVVEDITEQMHRETHLREAKENAEKASLSRGQFLANMSHEIRTPIQTIIGMMELLAETKMDEEQTEYARQVRFSADVMLTLINDILDLSKIEAGKMKIERIEFDLADVVERTVDLVSMEAHRKGIEICVDIDPTLPATMIGDPVRFRQILLNLVKNAVKFTERGYIIVKAYPEGDESTRSLHLDVLDTGIGVKSEFHDKLFNQFVQADSSTTRKYGGTGLGLAISRNIVELMGGRIGVKNNEPEGSVFWYDIPLTAAAGPLIGEGEHPSRGTRFLIVDDSPEALGILCKMLSSMGYTDLGRVTTGAQALDALTAAKRAGTPYDIVFIDMVMPEMDGWRLAAEINKNHEINEAQLYMVVPEGMFGADAKMKLLEWFNGYLYKPVKRRMLAELLDVHFQPSIDLEVVDELESVGELAAEHQAQASQREPAEKQPSLVRAAAALQAAKKTEAEATEKKNGEEFFGSGYTVLIAEDHPVNRKLLKTFIEKTGAKVIPAEDGQEATELIGKEKVDIVFMDVQMPRMNGYEATTWIREHGYRIPIIACTASAGEGDKEQCIASGMSSVLPKPYKKQDIFDVMKENLKRGNEENSAKAGSAEKIDTSAAAGKAAAESKREEAAPNPDEFDGNAYRDILMGDIDSARELAAEFIVQTADHLLFLTEDVRAMNRDAVRQTAHLIKGSALNMTANVFADKARIIEKNADTAGQEELREMLGNLSAAFERLKTLLSGEGFL